MTEEQQRIAIAEACGWKREPGLDYSCITAEKPHTEVKRVIYTNNGIACCEEDLPNYPHDLSAMNGAEKTLDSQPMDVRSLWLDYLAVTVEWPKTKNAADLRFEVQYRKARATADQRAEAFLRTIGKWKEEAKV